MTSGPAFAMNTSPRVGALVWRKGEQIKVVVVSDRAHADRVMAERGWDVSECLYLTESIDLHIEALPEA